jgi:NDP-sugar pyrophosphorylase family protein
VFRPCVREYEHRVPYGVVQIDGKYIQSMEEKLVQKCFINAGSYVVSPELVGSVRMKGLLDSSDVMGRIVFLLLDCS